MATAVPDYYCHKCQIHIGNVTNFECPRCRDNFIEEIPPQHPSSRSRRAHRTHVHRSTPFSNTTLFVGGNHRNDDSPDLGTFLQTVFTQISNDGNSQFPFVTHNGTGGTFFNSINLDAFLTHFLNQMGENSGPAPAAEHHINSIPTVKVTNEQVNDSLQCAICMDDFNENDDAKRLPCSHHFHEGCISRWLRMHGTCPTCRVTLEGNNTSNVEYYNVYPNQEQSSWNTNNRGNNGSDPSSGSTLFDFD